MSICLSVCLHLKKISSLTQDIQEVSRGVNRSQEELKKGQEGSRGVQRSQEEPRGVKRSQVELRGFNGIQEE